MMYFSYDNEDGIKFHDTAEEAKHRAEAALEANRDYASEGWEDTVSDICWGEVNGHVVETMRRPTTPEDDVDYDEFVDYALLDCANTGDKAL